MSVLVFGAAVALALFFLIFAIAFARRGPARQGSGSGAWYSDGGASYSDSGTSSVDCSPGDGGGGSCDGGGGGD